MTPTIRKFLFDIRQAAELLRQFTAGKNLQDYEQDAFLRSAVERQFEIIGEALNQAIKVDAELSTRISDARRIIAFRNILIHGYATVSHRIVWGILESNLPSLCCEVEQLLAESNLPT